MNADLQHARMPVIETRRLILRSPETGDARAIATALGDYAVAEMLARVPQPYDLKDAQDWLLRVASQATQDAPALAITVGGGLVGVVGLARRQGGLHVGYWLARSHWGRGIMSEALEATLDVYFAAWPDAVLHSGVFADNAASFAIQKKLGFAVIGRSDLFSLARNRMMASIDTVVTAGRFAARTAGRDNL